MIHLSQLTKWVLYIAHDKNRHTTGWSQDFSINFNYTFFSKNNKIPNAQMDFIFYI